MLNFADYVSTNYKIITSNLIMLLKQAANFTEESEAVPPQVQSFFNICFQGSFKVNLIYIFLL